MMHDVEAEMSVKELDSLIFDKKRKINLAFIKKLHKTAFKGEWYAGKIRKHPAWLKNFQGVITDTTVPPGHILEELKVLFGFLSKIEGQKETHNLIYFHVEFLHIHPFYDGNGIIARLLFNKMLHDVGLKPVVFTNINDDYYKAIIDWRNNDTSTFHCYIKKLQKEQE